jgi:hypothetical protein
MVESSDVSIVVDAQDCPPLPGLYGINEMMLLANSRNPPFYIRGSHEKSRLPDNFGRSIYSSL